MTSAAGSPDPAADRTAVPTPERAGAGAALVGRAGPRGVHAGSRPRGGRGASVRVGRRRARRRLRLDHGPRPLAGARPPGPVAGADAGLLGVPRVRRLLAPLPG